MQRRMMQQTFNSQAVKSFKEPLQKRVLTFLCKVLGDEDSYVDANKQCVATDCFATSSERVSVPDLSTQM